MKKFKFRVLFISLISILIIIGDSCGSSDENGCRCETLKTGKNHYLISPNNPTVTFTTYDLEGGRLIADGACHADMKIIFRWADDDKAATDERPPLSYEFRSLYGYFPANEGMEKHSIDYENYIQYWEISISEADDKTKPEGTSYGIYLQYDGPAGDNMAIDCSVTISYRYYDEAAYIDGCTLKGVK